MTTLLTQLETAQEGSRELSDAMLEELGWRQDHDADPTWYERTLWRKPDGSLHLEPDPDPTRNLQDAVDLVPDGWGWQIQDEGFAIIFHPDNRIDGEGDQHCQAATPCLALCAAIVRAKKQRGKNDG